MGLVLGVDFSAGEVTPAAIDAWKQQGVEFVVVQYSADLPRHLTQLEGSGLPLEVYVYLYFPLSQWNQTPEDRVRACIGMLHGHNVSRLWLNVEDPQDNDTAANIQAALQRCVVLVEAAGLQAGIYTSKSKYGERLGNSTAMSHLPLWHANFINRMPSDTEIDNFEAYNGWSRPSMWQWAADQSVGGINVDMDAMIVEEEMFVRFNNGTVDIATPNGLVDIRTPLGIPAAAKRVQLQGWPTGGEVEVYDGTTDLANRDAGRIFPPYGTVEVILSNNGECHLIGKGTTTIKLACLGYYT